jgi:hypothetical protein
MRRLVLRSFLALVVMLSPASAAQIAAPTAPAADTTSALCLDAARSAAARHGIPAKMMHAITLVETRRKVGGVSGPWPWTLNIKGKGYWYETRAEALARAAREISGGRLSVDLGCFQLNFRWHGENFNALDDMLEPALAADYAARFLGQLFAETGDWMRAAGLYHSRTPVHSRRYRGLVGQALASLDNAIGSAGGPDASGAPEPEPRVNGLIQARLGPPRPNRRRRSSW